MKNKYSMIETLNESFPNLQLNTEGLAESYTSISDEYDSLIYGVGIRDISFYKKIFIHGKESLNLLDRLSTNHLKDLNELEWERTVFTNTEGNIIDRTSLLRFEDYFILIGSCPLENKLRKWIDRFIINDDISTRDVSTDYSMFEIIGPESNSYMSLVLGDKQTDLLKNKIIRIQVENFFVHCIKFADVGKVEKYVLMVESKFASELCDHFIANTSAFNLNFVGETAYNIFRIERGIPIVPNELNDKFNPCEANLEDELDSAKKGYIGCDPIKKSAENQNSESRLSGVLFYEKLGSDYQDLTIQNEHGDQVGVITSIISSNMLDKTIGMGYVDHELNHVGLFAINGSRKFNITLTEFPIIR